MLLSMVILINYKHSMLNLTICNFTKQQIASNRFNSFTQAIKTRAAVRLKFLIAINLAIKIINLS